MHSARSAKLNEARTKYAVMYIASFASRLFRKRVAGVREKRNVLSQSGVTSRGVGVKHEDTRRLEYYHYGAASRHTTFALLNHSVYAVASLSRSHPHP